MSAYIKVARLGEAAALRACGRSRPPLRRPARPP
uniref:Uncharacterized protein n=1 Tax=Arundo donax TaxID=35708 RepID=A0A0A9EC96_ARUDO